MPVSIGTDAVYAMLLPFSGSCGGFLNGAFNWQKAVTDNRRKNKKAGVFIFELYDTCEVIALGRSF